MSAYDILKNNLEKEIGEFRDSYDNMTSQQTYKDWYIIGFKEEYYMMLMSDFVDGRFSEKEVAWLSSLKSPLAFLYEEWLSSDGAMDHDWDFMIDFVHTVYSHELRRDKQDLYREVDNLNVKVVHNPSEKYFSGYDFFVHVSLSPMVFSAELPNNCDKEVNMKVADFFKDNLRVKSCDYGCDTFPNSVSRLVAPGNVQTFQQPVWNFIDAVEEMFKCKCNFYNDVNGFEFVFEFGEENNKGCYVFGSGNNGQEFVQNLYFNNIDQINDAEFVQALTTIDKALYTLLEEYDLCVVTKSHEVSLEDKIAKAKEFFSVGVNNKEQNQDILR